MPWFGWGLESQENKLLQSIPDEELDTPLTEQQLAKISRSLSQWKVKGAILGLTEGEIEDIWEDNRSNEVQKVAMLRKWARKNGDQATLRLLIVVACQNGWEEFARSMCNSLGYIQNEG